MSESGNWGEQIADVDEGETSSSLDRLAPDAFHTSEAAEIETKWRILVWGRPGLGKSHFAFTMPEPICFIDTERKAEAIADKFSDREVFVWQPQSWDEARDALDQSLDVLDHFMDEKGQRGTIVVDSMSEMWDLSQQKHVEEHYIGKSIDEVEFSSAFGSGQGDWQYIKRYHNPRFRDLMLDTEYHICWTAMSSEDYNTQMEEDLNYTPEKPAGEKKNTYRASDIIRIEESIDGTPVGTLEKSSLTKHRYSGLEYPTFEKHRELVEEIRDVETEGGDVSDLDHDVRIAAGDPKYEESDD